MRRPILTTIVALATAISGCFYWGFTRVHADEQVFRSVEWMGLRDQAQQNDPGCVRGGMALYLIRSNLLKGKSRSELHTLLGEPDSAGQNEISYRLGQCHWDWKQSVLSIRMDEAGQVRDASIEVVT